MLNCKQSICFSSADNYPLVNISLKYLQHLATTAGNLYIKMNVCLSKLRNSSIALAHHSEDYILRSPRHLDEDVSKQMIKGFSGFPFILFALAKRRKLLQLKDPGGRAQICDIGYFHKPPGTGPQLKLLRNLH